MEKGRIKAGIVGSGFAASFHYEAAKKVYGIDVDVAGVFAIDTEQAREYAEKRGIRQFKNLEELIDAVDVIHACVPPSAHEQVALAGLEKDRVVIVEKPLTGYFGDGSDDFNGENCDKRIALDHSRDSIKRILKAEKESKGRILYAENWVYAPSIQKEREILEKTGGQILWMHGEEAHSGSHAATYGQWKFSGGGAMIGKGVHPLSAALYLKRVEGRARDGTPIRPASISAHTHAITRLPSFRDEGHIRSDYHDIEDFCSMHVVFEDGTIADIFASDIVHGGIHNWIEVNANNHKTQCNINPNTAMQTYNPVESNFDDIYVVEKIGTKQGWAPTSPDEDWFTGYPQEMEAFYRTVAYGDPAESDSALAADTIMSIYCAYVSADEKGVAIDIERLDT